MKKGTEYRGRSIAVNTRYVVAGHKPPVIASKPAAMFTIKVPSMGSASIHSLVGSIFGDHARDPFEVGM